jgi:Na+-transporting methylmalonyl-CoA/oxaloacetate decarboxylase beta subunit
MMHVGQVTGASSVSFIESMLFLAFFSLMALTPIIVPLLITLLAGKTGQKILVKLRAFMTKHNYIILFVLLTVLAAVFLSKSAEILLGLP